METDIRCNRHFQDTRDTQHIWKDNQFITDYAVTSHAFNDDASFSDALNNLYAWTKAQNKEPKKNLPSSYLVYPQ